MFGLIHVSARQFTIDRFGEETWRKVMDEAQLSDIHFLSGEVYGDEVTLKLIGAICETAGVTVAQGLEAFGRYWIGYVGASKFSPAMDAAGSDFATFIDNLDRLHRSVRTAMPAARMPSFEVISNRGEALRILYKSERAGLEPFVTGLLHGLLERFNQAGRIGEPVHCAGGVVFEITLAPKAAAA